VNRFVLDASVTAAWFLPADGEEFALRIRKRLAMGDRALVPALWSIEMANVLVKSVRKGVMTEQEAANAIGQLEILLIHGTRIEIHASAPVVSQAYAAAKKYGLSGYDGVYLVLAIEEKLPLATLDKDLISAATKAGLKLLP
jgi:predicted nucleic acid-binding protein